MPNTPIEPKAPPKTYTNWLAFQNAGLRPVHINCQAYQPYFPNDPSCHTRLKLDAPTMHRHLESEHGGGFQLFLQRTEGAKAHPLWKELMESGLEAADLRCEVCDEKLKLSPISLLPHCKPHRGKTRQAYSILAREHSPAVGFFDLAIDTKRNAATEDDEEA